MAPNMERTYSPSIVRFDMVSTGIWLHHRKVQSWIEIFQYDWVVLVYRDAIRCDVVSD